MWHRYSVRNLIFSERKKKSVNNKRHIQCLEKVFFEMIAGMNKAPQLSSTICKIDSLYVLIVCLADGVANWRCPYA